MELAGYTTAGPRPLNEDNYYVFNFPDAYSFLGGVSAFVMVSDGMGGYENGDLASKLAVQAATSYIGHLQEMSKSNKVELNIPSALKEIVNNANEAIRHEMAARGTSSMGATFVGAFISPTHAWIAHVGDSRAYLIQRGIAKQLTIDHSAVGKLLHEGLITEKQAQNHPKRNVIEKALGFTSDDPDITDVEIARGDALFLCSDGVSTVLDAQTIANTVLAAPNPDTAMSNVVSLAIKNNTDDNCTAVIAALNWDALRHYPSNGEPSVRSQNRHEVSTIVPGQRMVNSSPTNPIIENVPIAAEGAAATVAAGSVTVSPRRRVGASARPHVERRAAVQPQTVPIPFLSKLSSKGEVRISKLALFLGLATVALVAIVIGIWLGVSSMQDSSKPVADNMGQAQNSSGGSANGDDSGVEAAAPMLPSYELSEDSALKYVDADGVANQFSDYSSDITVLNLLSGQKLKASETEESFTRTFSYRALDDSYLQDLIKDFNAYSASSTLPAQAGSSTELSKIVDLTSYEAFLGQLKETGFDPSKEIMYLIVNSDTLERSTE